jgi:hypothetical protein
VQCGPAALQTSGVNVCTPEFLAALIELELIAP